MHTRLTYTDLHTGSHPHAHILFAVKVVVLKRLVQASTGADPTLTKLEREIAVMRNVNSEPGTRGHVRVSMRVWLWVTRYERAWLGLRGVWIVCIRVCEGVYDTCMRYVSVCPEGCIRGV